MYKIVKIIIRSVRLPRTYLATLLFVLQSTLKGFLIFIMYLETFELLNPRTLCYIFAKDYN